MIKEVKRILLQNTLIALDAIKQWDERTMSSYDQKYAFLNRYLSMGEFASILSQLITDYLADHKDKIIQYVSRDFLQATSQCLKTFSKYADKVHYEVPLLDINENIFKVTDHGKDVLRRLDIYEATNIRYHDYIRYGSDRLSADLKKCGYNCSVELSTDAFETLELENIIETGQYGIYPFLLPIMPTIIIKNQKN